MDDRERDGVFEALEVETSDTATSPWTGKRDVEVVTVSFWRMFAFFFDTVTVYSIDADECTGFHLVECGPGGRGGVACGGGGHCWRLIDVSSLVKRMNS